MAWTRIFAPFTRLPLTSCTTPCNVPRGFCAASSEGRRRQPARGNHRGLLLMRADSLFMSCNRLRKMAGLLPRVVEEAPGRQFFSEGTAPTGDERETEQREKPRRSQGMQQRPNP